MKSKFHCAKFVCWFFTTLIFLQSCTVYKASSISIAEAAQINKKVLVKTITINRLKLDKIEKKDTAYYGIKTIGQQVTSIPLREADILSIRPYDKSKSKSATLALIVIPILIVIAIVISNIDFAPDFGDSNTKN
jgi:ribosome recycling factor